MKTASIPSLRVDPELRQAAEAVLREGESLSALVETALRAQIDQRRSQQAFIARGLASRDAARKAGRYIAADDVFRHLEQRLARKRRAGA